MGVITDSIRMQYLTGVKLDLEYKIQLVTQSKMGLAQSASDLMQVGTDYSPDSPIVKQLNARQAKLKVLEQKLEQKCSNTKHGYKWLQQNLNLAAQGYIKA